MYNQESRARQSLEQLGLMTDREIRTSNLLNTGTAPELTELRTGLRNTLQHLTVVVSTGESSKNNGGETVQETDGERSSNWSQRGREVMVKRCHMRPTPRAAYSPQLRGLIRCLVGYRTHVLEQSWLLFPIRPQRPAVMAIGLRAWPKIKLTGAGRPQGDRCQQQWDHATANLGDYRRLMNQCPWYEWIHLVICQIIFWWLQYGLFWMDNAIQHLWNSGQSEISTAAVIPFSN